MGIPMCCKIVSTDENRGVCQLGAEDLVYLFGYWWHDSVKWLSMIELLPADPTLRPDLITALARQIVRLPDYDPDLHLGFIKAYAQMIRDTLARLSEDSLTSGSADFRMVMASSLDLLATIDMYTLLFEKGEYHLIPMDMQRADDRKCVTGPLMYIMGSPEGVILGSPLLFRILTRNIYANANDAQRNIGVSETPRVVVHVTPTQLVLDYTNKGQIPRFMLDLTEMPDRQNLFVRGTTTHPPDETEHGIGGAIIFDMVQRMKGTVEALNLDGEAVIRVMFPIVA